MRAPRPGFGRAFGANSESYRVAIHATRGGCRSRFLVALLAVVVVQGGQNGIRFLLVSGQPLQEPVAWSGPIVMNTQAELRQAFDELEQGTFLEHDQR